MEERLHKQKTISRSKPTHKKTSINQGTRTPLKTNEEETALNESIVAPYFAQSRKFLHKNNSQITFSAKPLLTTSQQIFIFLITSIVTYGLITDHELTATLLIMTGNVIFSFLLVTKTFLLTNAINKNIIKRNKNRGNNFYKPPTTIQDALLPCYSVLIPLYKEADVVDNIISNILTINYPKEKLQVLLIVETDDIELKKKLQKTQIPKHFSIVVVPLSTPKTKAKACNFAMRYVYGELLTIFDADDKPEIDQLKKAVDVFNRNPNIACLQSRLCYYNQTENWLTKMFDIEYRSLFSYLLPSLSSLNSPTPLGGSSNHFRTNILRDIGGWDDYNVTEDAELGIRMAINKLKIEMLDSYTEEEAPTTIMAWLKQRSRWIKGHITTYMIYMRNPKKTFITLGPCGFITFNYMLGISQISLILSPILFIWVILYALDFINFKSVDSTLVFLSNTTSLVNIASGMVVSFLNALIATKTNNKITKIFLSFSFCFYLSLLPLAALMALFELITKPYHWNKTTHGVSEYFKK